MILKRCVLSFIGWVQSLFRLNIYVLDPGGLEIYAGVSNADWIYLLYGFIHTDSSAL